MKKIFFLLVFLFLFNTIAFAGVGNDGSYSTSLPLEIPPSPDGLAPSLSLNYNSNTKEGILGVGWSLGGIPKIEKESKSGNDTTGVVYSTPWGRVVAIGGSFTPVVYSGVDFECDNDTLYVTTKDGSQYTFKAQSNGVWILDSHSDFYGNSYEVTYVQHGTEYYPQTVSYSSGKKTITVSFSYSERTSAINRFEGRKYNITHKLNSVTISRGETVVGTYTLNYSSDNTLRLSSIGKSWTDSSGTANIENYYTFGWDNSICFGEFDYDGTSSFSSVNGSIVKNFEQDAFHVNLDINGDGIQDSAVITRSGTHLTVDASVIWSNNNCSSIISSNLVSSGIDLGSVPYIDYSGSGLLSFYNSDVNGDGLEDILMVRYAYRNYDDSTNTGYSLQFFVFFSDGSGHFTQSRCDYFDTGDHTFATGVKIKGGEIEFSHKPSTLVGDYNGDGKTDILITGNQTWNWDEDETAAETADCFLYLSTSHENYLDFDLKYDRFTWSYKKTRYSSNPDINGDGFPDLVYYGVYHYGSNDDKGEVYINSYLNDGDGNFSDHVYYYDQLAVYEGHSDWGTYGLEENQLQVRNVFGDLNGDGYDDFAIVLQQSHLYSIYDFLSDGTGLTNSSAYNVYAPDSLSGGLHYLSLTDYDGDGYDDLYLNGFSYRGGSSAFNYCSTLGAGSVLSTFVTRFLHIASNDWVDRVVETSSSSSVCNQQAAYSQSMSCSMYREYNTVFDPPQPTGYSNVYLSVATFDYSSLSSSFYNNDINRDGLNDFTINEPSLGAYSRVNSQKVVTTQKLSNSKAKYLLNKITDYKGQYQEISYSLNDPLYSNSSFGGTEKRINPKPRIVVSTITNGSGTIGVSSSTYTYGTPYMAVGSYLNRADLGFDSIESSTDYYDGNDNTIVKTTYYTDGPQHAGRVYKTYKSSQGVVSKQEFCFDTTVNTDNGIDFYHVRPSNTYSYSDDLDIITHTKYSSYDSEDNPGTVTTKSYIYTGTMEKDDTIASLSSLGVLASSSKTMYTYTYSPITYPSLTQSYVDGVKTGEVKKTLSIDGYTITTDTLVDEDGNKYATVEQKLNSNGTLDKSIASTSGTDTATTNYSYSYAADSYTVNVTAPTGEVSVTQYEYTRGQKIYEKSPTGTTLAYTYEPAYGRLKTIVDKTYSTGGLTLTSIIYDGFDSKTTTTKSYADYNSCYNGISSLTGKNITLSSVLGWSYSDATVNNTIIEIEDYDDLGRVTKSTKSYVTSTETSDDQNAVSKINMITDITYNPDGTVASKTLPYAEGYDTDKKVTYTYDSRKRLTKKTMANGGVYTYTYSEGSGISTKTEKFDKDEESYTTSVTTDIPNRTTTKTEANGNTLVFKNNKRGQLVSVTNCKGTSEETITEITYNIAGWKSSMTDPDTGTYNYKYDKRGLMTKQTDAMSNYVLFEYDKSGRNTKTIYKNSSDAELKTISYSYNSDGTLNSVDEGFMIHNFEYDRYGNPLYIARTIKGQKYIFLMNYDTSGRVVRLTYPDGYELTRKYSDGEFLKCVEDTSSGYDWVKYGRFRIDAEDGSVHEDDEDTVYRITGNGVTTKVGYDPETFKVTSVVSSTSNKYNPLLNLEDLSYTYDARGNVATVTDNIGSKAQMSATYEYDKLGRITYAKGNWDDEYKNMELDYVYSNSGNLTTKGSDKLSYDDSTHPHAVTSREVTNSGITTKYYYKYDKMGRMTRRKMVMKDGSKTGGQTLTYDEGGRLKSVTGDGVPSEYYYYDYTGARVYKLRQDDDDSTNYIGTTTIDGLFEVTDFGKTDSNSRRGTQFTRYILGLNNEVVAQTTVSSNILLAKTDPLVYNYIYDKRSLKGFSHWCFYLVSDIVYSKWTFVFLVSLSLLAVFIVTLYGFWHSAVQHGFAYAFKVQLKRCAVTFAFSTFALFNGCYYEEEAEVDTPKWMQTDETDETSDDSGATDTTDTTDTTGTSGTTDSGSNADLLEQYGSTVSNDSTSALSTAGVPDKNVRFFHPDYTGNISYTTDWKGEVKSRMMYTPYGNTKVYGENAQRNKFNNHELDRTGLQYFNARYYDNDTGRFITPDPTVPDPTATQCYNRYMFVEGNPISFMDIDGYKKSRAVRLDGGHSDCPCGAPNDEGSGLSSLASTVTGAWDSFWSSVGSAFQSGYNSLCDTVSSVHATYFGNAAQKQNTFQENKRVAQLRREMNVKSGPLMNVTSVVEKNADKYTKRGKQVEGKGMVGFEGIEYVDKDGKYSKTKIDGVLWQGKSSLGYEQPTSEGRGEITYDSDGKYDLDVQWNGNGEGGVNVHWYNRSEGCIVFGSKTNATLTTSNIMSSVESTTKSGVNVQLQHTVVDNRSQSDRNSRPITTYKGSY